MRSTLVEFSRFRELGTGILRKGDEYLRTIQNHPVHQIYMKTDQLPFNKKMRSLRYMAASESERISALEALSELVSGLLMRYEDDDRRELDGPLLKELTKGSEALQQIDLVANAAELSALPFEAALSEGGDPLFLSGEGVVLTRRVRGDFRETITEWPVKPRVLFVWSAAGGDVPYEAHRETLLKALTPWLPLSDIESVFVEIGNAKRKDIEEAVKDGGFTHFHLLAHGQVIAQEEDDRFGITLNHRIEGPDVVTPEQISAALEGIRSSAMVVTLAACDGGNQTDVINPAKSLAYLLHDSGFPVVVASQLPLTISGSNIFAQSFYRDLFEGLDVREALHRARVELYERREEAGHDWVSLVGYVQLREGYADFLEEIRLRAQLSSLTNLRDRAEVLAEQGASGEELLTIREALKGRIEALKNQLSHSRGGAMLHENRGLLGSAEKRLAEVCFRHFDDEVSHHESREALKRARNWYRDAFIANPSHHWSGVQYLALHAALTGQVNEKEWKTAYYAAEVDRMRPTEYWAQGSLAELALLGRIINKQTDESAENYLHEMKERIGTFEGDITHDPIESTKLQLRRYVEWWRPTDGFFPDTPDLAQEAERLAELISN